MAKLGAEEWRAEARRYAGKAPDAISVREIDLALPDTGRPLRRPKPEAIGRPFQPRQLGRQLASIRQRTSYSSLATSSGAAQSEVEHQEAERPDHDPNEPDLSDEVATVERPAEDDELTVFTFPSGNRPGKCLHEIFEKRLQPDHDPDSIYQTALARYRIDSKWEPVVRTLVQDTLETPLSQPGEAGNVFRVADLERPIPEMEFHLPVKGFSRAELAECLREHGYHHALPDSRNAIDGFLHGYIDVVARNDHLWYVLDYKSNWLGSDLSMYSAEGLAQAMRRHGYHLQYLLYLTAPAPPAAAASARLRLRPSHRRRVLPLRARHEAEHARWRRVPQPSITCLHRGHRRLLRPNAMRSHRQIEALTRAWLGEQR